MLVLSVRLLRFPPEPTGTLRTYVRGKADLPLERLEHEICQLAGHINAGACRWLELVAEFDRREGWGSVGMSIVRRLDLLALRDRAAGGPGARSCGEGARGAS